MKWLFILTLTLTSLVQATEVQRIKFDKRNRDGEVKIYYKGYLKTTPELSFKKNHIDVIIPGASLAQGLSSIKKAENFSTKTQEDTLVSAINSKDSALVSLKFPFNMERKKTLVTLSLKNNYIKLTFPRVRVAESTLPQTQAPQEKVAAKKSKNVEEILGEQYLEELLKEEKKEKSPMAEAVGEKKELQDEVQVTQAATESRKSEFSIVSYLGKFVAFLGFVLLLFYGLVVLFKKGVFKRTKLGFLNNTNQIEVLSQTHISPKKSLMMVKVHKQIFLLSNTENGMQFLSEIKDPMGVVKDGERIISGDNFDTSLVEKNNDESIESKIVLKENIHESKPLKENNKKFREQIKKKVRELKPLQQQL